ncbi:KR domain-containing protein [Nocardia sp. NPDC046763]|uniref:KR domain-containing protein n=1 Tax=Nocardia sp. NPDC046763 TaxID=3155256 RepID=UPI0033E8F120
MFEPNPVAAVLGARSSWQRSLCLRLRAEGWTVYTETGDIGDRLDVVLWSMPATAAGAEVALDQLARVNYAVGQLITRLEGTATAGRTAFLAVTRIDGARGLRSPARAGAVVAGVSGLVKTIVREAPSMFARAVDLDPSLDDERVSALIRAELHDDVTDLTEIGYDSSARRGTVAASEPIAFDHVDGLDLDGRDTMLVTGGARGITAACVRALAARCDARFLLLGRTPLSPEPGWAHGVGETELRAAYLAEVRHRPDRPTPVQIGATVKAVIAGREVWRTLESVDRATYLECDIADRAALHRTLHPWLPEVTALTHGAGILSDRFLRDKTLEEILRVLDAKLTGLLHLFDVLETDRLRHLVLFSSVAGWYGNSGQADYASANEALNRLAVWFGGSSDCVVSAVNWGPWEGGMVGPALARLIRSRGVEPIAAETGGRLFADLFARDRRGIAVELIAPLSHPDFARGSSMHQAP